MEEQAGRPSPRPTAARASGPRPSPLHPRRLAGQRQDGSRRGAAVWGLGLLCLLLGARFPGGGPGFATPQGLYRHVQRGLGHGAPLTLPQFRLLRRRAPLEHERPGEQGQWDRMAMRYILSWTEGGYLDWSYRKAQVATQQYSRTLTLCSVLLGAALTYALSYLGFTPLVHCCGHGAHASCEAFNPMGFVSWMAAPGQPDATFGSLCLYSNVFYALLGPVLWFRRRIFELVLVGMVGMASSVYHGLQIHPSWGPLHSWTTAACVFDICLALTFGVVLIARYPQTRMRALPALVGALLCFFVPSLVPASVAEVSYTFLHSAWHFFSALSAYQIVRHIPAQAPKLRHLLLSHRKGQYRGSFD